MTMPIRPPAGVVSPLELKGPGIELQSGDGKFGELLNRALGDVQAAQDNRDDIIGAFLRGENVELHQVMSAAEEASLSLSMLVEVRNKLTDAYRSVMNLQV